MYPFTVRDKNFESVDTFMGITTEWTDRETKGLKFKPTSDYESFDKVLKQKYWPTGEPNDVLVGVNFHFSEIIYEN